MELPITNIVNVSVADNPRGAGAYNTSNVAIFSDEEYDAELFGDDGYKIYLEPTEVGDDFGTDSITYKMALGIFGQQPNILAGGGYLVVIPLVTEIQLVDFDANPGSGTFKLNYGMTATATINWDDTASEVQTALRAIEGLEKVVVTGAISTTGLTVKFFGVYGSLSLLTASNNTLAVGGSTAVNITISEVTDGEKLDEAITRTKDLVQYFGILETAIIDEADMLDAAAVVQALVKIAGFVSRTEADIDPAGRLDKLRSGNLWHSRGIYYGADNDSDALVMIASYFGRGLSVDFSGSNTTLTMQLKDLSGVQPDPSMTQTIYTKCETAGVDIYVSFQGVAKVVSNGANKYFDQAYNLLWFVGAIQIAGFNYLATTSTKIPQTESGMDGLKGAYNSVCQAAVTCAYAAPGSWTSPVTFGNQSDFLQNIAQLGFYLYSVPISQQLQVDREDRKAPLVQIALKEAGAIHTSNVIVNVNA